MENKLLQKNFDKMLAELGQHGKLFRSSLSGDELWSTYLQGFGEDPIYRDQTSSLHKCNTCKNFIRRYGTIVVVGSDNKISTLFDGVFSDEYQNSFRLMSEKLKEAPILNIFVETFDFLNKSNYERTNKKQPIYALGLGLNTKTWTVDDFKNYPGFSSVKVGETSTFEHFCIKIPTAFIDKSGASAESILGLALSTKEVFKRGLDVISLDTLNIIRDLIEQDSILDGRSQLGKVEKMISLKTAYESLPADEKDNWCWKMYDLSRDVSRFKNELIGVLACEIEDGDDIAVVCTNWNKRVDPANYMKAKAPITKNQIREAEDYVKDNGLEDSFDRRCAVLEDISAEEILHMNEKGTGEAKVVSIFDKVKDMATTSSGIDVTKILKNSDKLPTVKIQDFMSNVLPGCKSVEVLLENRESKNMVSLTTSAKKGCKNIFKWDNNFSWTYNGNLSGMSQVKAAVKNAGGFVDAPFRFSIMWNESGQDIVDLDAHATQPDGKNIFYGTYKNSIGQPNTNMTSMTGQLDIDMIRPEGVGVENIYWTDLGKLGDGNYRLYINNYDGRSNKNPKKAEVYFDGELFQYTIPAEITSKIDLTVAVVTIKNGKMVGIQHCDYLVDSGTLKKEVWGLMTGEFHQVRLLCKSPNYWTNKVGNKHYFFMLKGCKNPDPIRSFHNDNLSDDLLKHRKVFDILGNTLKVPTTDNQLSGIGFDETMRDSVILRIDNKKLIKVEI